MILRILVVVHLFSWAGLFLHKTHDLFRSFLAISAWLTLVLILGLLFTYVAHGTLDKLINK